MQREMVIKWVNLYTLKHTLTKITARLALFHGTTLSRFSYGSEKLVPYLELFLGPVSTYEKVYTAGLSESIARMQMQGCRFIFCPEMIGILKNQNK
jgi:hypothetical protein